MSIDLSAEIKAAFLCKVLCERGARSNSEFGSEVSAECGVRNAEFGMHSSAGTK